MKSCLVVLRTNHVAGAERVSLSLIDSLRSRFNIDVATLRHQKKGTLALSGNKIRGIFTVLFGRYDLIHSNLFLPGLILRFRRIFDPYFYWIHSVHYEAYNAQSWGGIKKYFDQRWIFPSVNQLVAVSPSVLDSLADFPDAIQIENAIPLSAKRLPGKVFPEDLITLGSVAMLREEKGVSNLIYLTKALRDKNINVRLQIAGDGPLKSQLIRLVKKLDLSPHIELLGYVKDVDAFLNSIDIYVNPSRMESFGLALLDAMAYSLPIVATDVGEIPALLGHGEFGQLAKYKTFISSAVKKIERIIASPKGWQIRSHQGLLFHRTRLSPAKLARQFESLYQRGLRPGLCMISPIVTQATGGLQKQLKLQSQELNRLGYQVYILQRQDEEIASKYHEWKHATFLSTPNPSPNWGLDSRLGLRLRGMLFIFTATYQLFKNRGRIQFVHAHQLYSPTLVGVIAKLLFKMNLVVKVTASGLLGELRELKKLPFFSLRLLSFRLIDKVIVLSEEMRQEVLRLGFSEKQILLLPNSVDIPAKSRIGEVTTFSGSVKLNILFCGRLSSEKSLHTLIEASAQVQEEGYPCSVHLVGGTYGGRDTTQELKDLAQKLKSKIEVIFYGNQADVSKFYLAADVFVLPSLSEGMSNSLLEALSFGLPCVVSDIVPNRTLVTDEINGLLFTPGDVAGLAHQLKRIAQDQRENGTLSFKLGSHARELIKKRYSSRVICEQLDQIYRSLPPPGEAKTLA